MARASDALREKESGSVEVFLLRGLVPVARARGFVFRRVTAGCVEFKDGEKGMGRVGGLIEMDGGG